MEYTRTEGFRRMLYTKKAEMLAGSHKGMKNILSGDHRALIGTGLKEDDMSFFCQSERIQCGRLNSSMDIIKKIDAALDRLEDGEYGRCEECNDEISEERLRAVPFAALCRECQESLEVASKTY